MLDSREAALGYGILRVGTGLNLLMHGWVRTGKNFAGFQSWLTSLFANTQLPVMLLDLMSYVIPGAELVLGILLLSGFKTRLALIGSGALMIGLIFGMSLLQKWEIVGLQMTYLLIYATLLFTFRANRYSLDHLYTKG